MLTMISKHRHPQAYVRWETAPLPRAKPHISRSNQTPMPENIVLTRFYLIFSTNFDIFTPH